MQPDWAVHNLQVIRTLMERSAIYRRALAPVMLVTGGLGLAAAVAGTIVGIEAPRGFIVYWLAVSFATLVVALLLVRRQALRASEPFWSPPTRRVSHAVTPSFVAALIVSCAVWFLVGTDKDSEMGQALATELLPLIWVVLYGCASNAAGFFMRRGIRLFGWLLLAGGAGAFAIGVLALPRVVAGHAIMGFFFGVLHLGYGVYLLLTEPRADAM